MHKKIKLLLVALGLGFSAIAVYASCDQCDQENPPAEANCPPDDPEDPSGSMPENVIVDDTIQHTEKTASKDSTDKAAVTPSKSIEIVSE